VPVPFSDAVSSAGAPPTITFIVAVRSSRAEGTNRTRISQLLFGPRLPPHVLELTMKSPPFVPVNVSPLIVTGSTSSPLVTVKVRGRLTVVTPCSP
jgi:hypothetical protein